MEIEQEENTSSQEVLDDIENWKKTLMIYDQSVENEESKNNNTIDIPDYS